MSMTPYKLSLISAIVINVNIMTSAGIFLNSIPFSMQLGALSPMPYLVIGILLIPLIIAIAQLLAYVPEGNFYVIGKTLLSPLAGFTSTWSYFVAKLASASLMIHYFVSCIQEVIPALAAINPFVIDAGVIAIFIMLNIFDMRISRSIMLTFLSIKGAVITAIITLGFWYFQPLNFAFAHLKWGALPTSLPLAIYAFAGFEATLSLINHIENPQRNGPRAIFYSYGLVIGMYCLYQLCYYAAIHPELLGNVNSFKSLGFFVQSTVTTYAPLLSSLFYLGIGIAALGGAYGIFFSNAWNLHTLATHEHTWFNKTLAKTNNAGIAYWCLIAEALVCLTYLLSTHANQILMQQISALGGMIAYSITIIAFVQFVRTTLKQRWAYIIGWLALFNCALMLASCINSLYQKGICGLYIFSALVLSGIGMYYANKKREVII